MVETENAQVRQTPRARRRELTEAEIKSHAFAQLRSSGPAGISLRAIAREMDMSSAAIFRYYASHDDLVLALIVDAFDALGATLAAAEATPGTPDERFVAAIHAYRNFARTSPHLYALVFTDSIPGFVAPPEGPTAAAARDAMAPFSRLARAICGQSAAAEPSRSDADFLPIVMRAWGRWHGLVSLEVFHHLDWTGLELDRLFAAEVDSIMTDLCEQLRPSGG